jgi:hypothetical protein
LKEPNKIAPKKAKYKVLLKGLDVMAQGTVTLRFRVSRVFD